MKTPKTLLRFALLAGLSFSAIHVASAQQYFMKIPGVEGSATFDGGTTALNYSTGDAMEIEGFAFANSRSIDFGGGGSAGFAQASSMSIYMVVDPKSMPKLLELSINGAEIGDVGPGGGFLIDTVKVAGGGGTAKKASQIKIKGQIESFNIQGSTGDQMFVEIQVKLRQIRVETFIYKPDGTPDGSKVFAWDYSTNTAP